MNRSLLADLLLRRRRILLVEPDTADQRNQAIFLAHLFQMGYTVENPDNYSDSLLKKHHTLMEQLKELKGGQVTHVPLYAKFPEEVPEPDEYFLKRLMGYVLKYSRWEVPGEKLSTGFTVPKWLFDLELFGADPISQRQELGLFLKQKFQQLTRRKESARKPTVLRLLPHSQAKEELETWLRWCLCSKTSFPDFYREEILLALKLFPDFSLQSQEVSFREHRATYMAHLWDRKRWEELAEFCQVPSDILRLLVQLEQGDVSLAEVVTFPKLKRRHRRRVLALLDKMGEGPVVEDQLMKYRGLWLALERSLHSGEFQSLFPSACSLLRRLQAGTLKRRFTGLERALAGGQRDDILRELESLPGGVTLRRFCHALAAGSEGQDSEMLDLLLPKLGKAALKDQFVLKAVLQRDATAKEAMILTKRGCTQVVPREPARLHPELRQKSIDSVGKLIGETVRAKFGVESWLDKAVYVDPELRHWPVPTSLRSASDALTVMGRGTKLKLGSQKAIRMFVYWKQHFRTTDLDLSAVAFNDVFQCTGHVSWTNLKESGMVHSGDLQSAPFGAAEFIDAEISTLAKQGHRYLGMLVYRYCGEFFSDMECFCGWMMREKTDSSYKSFDIATVEQKMLLTGEVTYALPVLFDLQEREALWLDLRVYGTGSHNQVGSSWHNLERLVRLGVQMSQWKLHLAELAEWHIRSRGATQTQDREKADIVFALDPTADYHPGVWTKILSELL